MFSIGQFSPDDLQDEFLNNLELIVEDISVGPSPPSLLEGLRETPFYNSTNNDSTNATPHRHSVRTVTTVEEKHARILEKNRRAQKKFREKQKNKLSCMEKQIEELSNKVQCLEIEKKELSNRTDLLERILRDKDAPSQNNANGYPQPSVQSAQSSRFQYEPIDQAADSEQIKQVEGSYYVSSLQKTIDSEMIRNLHLPTVQEFFLETWEQIISEIERRLRAVEVPNPSQEDVQRLSAAVSEYRACMLRMFVINPVGTKELGLKSKFNIKRFPQSFGERGKVESLTREVLKKMELSDAQKGAISFVWKRYCEVQKECKVQREEIAAKLGTLGPGLDMQWSYYQDFMQTHKLVLRVRENWRQDYKNHWDFIQIFMIQILTPLQFARMISYMQPYLVDGFIICKLISEDVDSQTLSSQCIDTPSPKVASHQLPGNITQQQDNQHHVPGNISPASTQLPLSSSEQFLYNNQSQMKMNQDAVGELPAATGKIPKIAQQLHVQQQLCQQERQPYQDSFEFGVQSVEMNRIQFLATEQSVFAEMEDRIYVEDSQQLPQIQNLQQQYLQNEQSTFVFGRSNSFDIDALLRSPSISFSQEHNSENYEQPMSLSDFGHRSEQLTKNGEVSSKNKQLETKQLKT
eukprot:TRINITY_DN7457_c0_g3_i1.p1 TRINITY_DN7457_c0_g3~~TRINITY_DN7457_c0_g3_i1.p1  ORF type:complete len:634 (-),score=75.49 TRINITY_DN7457_c0_g3_i1:892-2793(-)